MPTLKQRYEAEVENDMCNFFKVESIDEAAELAMKWMQEGHDIFAQNKASLSTNPQSKDQKYLSRQRN